MGARNDKLVGASLEAAAYLYIPDDEMIYPSVKTDGVDELRTVLMLSQVHLVDAPEEIAQHCDEPYISSTTESGVTVGVAKAQGTKCARCWFYGKWEGDGDICQRCQHAVEVWETKEGVKFEKEEEAVPTA